MNDLTPVTTAPAQPVKTLPDAQTVTDVKHYSDRLFSFRVTRPRSLRFRSGEFVMIGLMGNNGKPILRAYSIASPSWDEELEFYSIKVPDGPLTSKLQKIAVGDEVILRPKPVGTLVLDALLPGKRLHLFSTGTGVAPFASLIRDPETYERFEEVILTHTTWRLSGQTYSDELIARTLADPLVGEEAAKKLRYYPTTTREESPKMGRVTTLIEDGTYFADIGIERFTVGEDRAMLCGSMGFNLDMKAIFEGHGLEEGANSEPAHYVLEKAFVG